MREYRLRIDAIDLQMKNLFLERMDIVKKIAEEKKAKGLAILNPEREREIIDRLTVNIEDRLIFELYEKFLVHIMDLSKTYQIEVNKEL
jgi:monofunctional chorismate mutase